jgi:hypothetical protein
MSYELYRRVIMKKNNHRSWVISAALVMGFVFVTAAFAQSAGLTGVTSFTRVSGAAFGTSHINCATWGNGMFVAGGDEGKIGRSADGITWTLANISGFGSARINGIAYGGGRFVAVGEDWKIAYSPDGITWTSVDGSPFWRADCITYGNGKFVAGGNDGESMTAIAWSTDGIAWNTVSGLPFPFEYGGLFSITRNDAGNYFAFSANGMGVQTIGAYSQDAVTWTISIEGPYSEKSGVVYGSGKFVWGFDHVIGYTDGKNGALADGFSWKNNPASIFGASLITCVAYGTDLFLAGGADGKLAFSPDGVNWKLLAESGFGTTPVNAIAFGNGRFIAVGNDGKIAYSQ